VQANYRYFHQVDVEALDRLIQDLRSGALAGEVPDHGTLGLVRQDLPPEELANVTPPEDQVIPPWIARHEQMAAGEAS
jgi:hypothetical protein